MESATIWPASARKIDSARSRLNGVGSDAHKRVLVDCSGHAIALLSVSTLMVHLISHLTTGPLGYSLAAAAAWCR